MTPYAREWSPLGLALSCVLAAFALCLHADNQLLLYYEANGASLWFVGAFLLGVVTLCIAVLVSAHDEEQRRWSIGLGLVTGMVGILFGLCAQALPPVVSAVGAGGLLGFGLTCLLRQWGRYYRLFSFQGALLNTMIAFVAASCLWLGVAHAGTPFLFCLGMLALVCCGGLPLLASQIVHADESEPRTDVVASAKSIATMRQVVRLGWAAVVGLMLNFFTIGLAFWPEAAGLGTTGLSPKPLAYAALAVVVWWVVARAHEPVGGILDAFYRASLPVAAAIMLACPFIESAVPFSGSLLFSVVSYVGVAVCNVLGLVVLFWTARFSEVGFSKVFAAFCASCAGSVAAGMIVFQLLGKSAQMVSLCLLAVYLVAMVLAEVRVYARAKRQGKKTDRPSDEGAPDLAEEFE